MNDGCNSILFVTITVVAVVMIIIISVACVHSWGFSVIFWLAILFAIKKEPTGSWFLFEDFAFLDPLLRMLQPVEPCHEIDPVVFSCWRGILVRKQLHFFLKSQIILPKPMEQIGVNLPKQVHWLI